MDIDHWPSELQPTAAAIIAAAQKQAKRPLLIALDGGSGAGKSTLAALIARQLNAALIPSDDFYSAHISNAEWDSYTPAQKVTAVIDWRRLRTDALEPLLTRKPARWHPFDFNRIRSDGTYPLSEAYVERAPADFIVLDGAYSARPELADLIDLAVLVDVPIAVRHARLSGREPADFLASWHARWDVSEDHYFTYVRPKSSFDVVVTI
ncbi:MAG TPA: zeta toxin family protein [Phototrophicaceae bacterium]|nr:zeta toxin family protein [Phototrophicaceae bacterium]